jgi:hypothetical protein
VPLEESAPRPLFGYLKGSVTINGDIIGPLGEPWDADRDG